jgi:peptide/nickel transport system substrate-binding protein
MPSKTALTRRRVLELFGAGAAGSVLLAACGQSEQAQKNKVAEFHGGTDYVVPPKGHFNLLTGVTDGILSDSYFVDLILAPSAMYKWKEREWVPMLGEKWSTDKAANTFTLTLKQGLKWSDGKPITTKDVLTSFWCLRVMRNVSWDYLDKVEATDDQTVVFTMKRPSTVLERYVLRQQIYSDATYGTWAKRAQDLFASGGDLDSPEGKKLNTELQAFRPEQAIASGPFNYDYKSITNAQLSFVKNENGYAADKVLFDKVIVFNGETADITPVVLSKNVDYATHGFPPATEKQLTSSGFRIIRPPVYSGPALLFNLDKLTEFKDVRVRQALAHAIDRPQNGEVSLAESGKGVKFMAGFSDNLVPDWLSAADQEKLEPYDHDLDKATALLTQAGWKKAGNAWQKPDGTPAAYELIFPAEYVDWAASGTNVAQQLTTFGIKIEARGVNQIQQPIDVDKGNFQLAIQGWGTSSHPHPHFAFVQNLFTHNIPTAANNGGRGMGFELAQTSKTLGKSDLQ